MARDRAASRFIPMYLIFFPSHQYFCSSYFIISATVPLSHHPKAHQHYKILFSFQPPTVFNSPPYFPLFVLVVYVYSGSRGRYPSPPVEATGSHKCLPRCSIRALLFLSPAGCSARVSSPLYCAVGPASIVSRRKNDSG